MFRLPLNRRYLVNVFVSEYYGITVRVLSSEYEVTFVQSDHRVKQPRIQIYRYRTRISEWIEPRTRLGHT